ncbi:hypothetical protein AXE80_07280 [Wenyingzhuangia fucanilytica]|uniref:Acyltransferase 3 domain-containing protein n=1 Tax=Wenyingzhuangia fucanilytica TaxID=1790137 RepID=A0A1B1Y5N3_9FLAO|nr:acyltransferase [Wenyingzhuangia fucanilytica]ANW96092.1 hypothetical protein AXE80_07280 [Wenyingzhuangia fucanilytica]
MNYISGLNGVRAIAVFLVVIAHWFPQDHFLKIFPIGNFGVDVFFVLSGFLISRILFQEIKKNTNKVRILKVFLWRRFIRIFPIYYLTLFFLYLTRNTIGNNFVENINWYLFYVSNYLNYKETKWFGALAHLWSLSVEEQFYLFWPLLLLFIIKKKNILITGIMFIIIGTIYPFIIGGWHKVLTIACLNTFGSGIILAYSEVFEPKWKNIFFKYIKSIGYLMLSLIIINYLIYKIPFFSTRLATSIIAVQIIIFFKEKKEKNIIYRVCNSKVLDFLGMISYGLYLYHNLVPRYWKASINKLGLSTPYSKNYEFTYWESFLMVLILILTSYISWVIIEKPFLKLKKYISY